MTPQRVSLEEIPVMFVSENGEPGNSAPKGSRPALKLYRSENEILLLLPIT